MWRFTFLHKICFCWHKLMFFARTFNLDKYTLWKRLIRTLLVLCIELRESGLAPLTVYSFVRNIYKYVDSTLSPTQLWQSRLFMKLAIAGMVSLLIPFVYHKLPKMGKSPSCKKRNTDVRYTLYTVYLYIPVIEIVTNFILHSLYRMRQLNHHKLIL